LRSLLKARNLPSTDNNHSTISEVLVINAYSRKNKKKSTKERSLENCTGVTHDCHCDEVFRV